MNLRPASWSVFAVAEIKSSSIFDFFKGSLRKYETKQDWFKGDPDEVNEYKKKEAQAKKIVDTILNIIKKMNTKSKMEFFLKILIAARQLC